MKKLYFWFCKFEETVVAVLIVLLTGLVFLSAVMRTMNQPINWAQDLALLLFAWIIMLGADVALRRADFIRISILVERFPNIAQKFLYYLWYLLILIFLGILVRYGIPLAFDSRLRLFQTLGISYSWATMSVPVGALLMMLTISLKMITNVKKKAEDAEEVA
jgi:TRAP-type C4-dicarboxylate transport system permease small subunit